MDGPGVNLGRFGMSSPVRRALAVGCGLLLAAIVAAFRSPRLSAVRLGSWALVLAVTLRLTSAITLGTSLSGWLPGC